VIGDYSCVSILTGVTDCTILSACQSLDYQLELIIHKIASCNVDKLQVSIIDT
jgi:hypothetical protein